MCNIQILFSTIDDSASAEKVAKQLVEERLAACVNVLPGVTSVYHWQGKVQHEQEHLLILKTPTDRVEALIERLKELHPYEVPEMISLSVQSGYRPYLDWVLQETRTT
jgi:periplasmic divalent cation tolerance protein